MEEYKLSLKKELVATINIEKSAFETYSEDEIIEFIKSKIDCDKVIITPTDEERHELIAAAHCYKDTSELQLRRIHRKRRRG